MYLDNSLSNIGSYNTIYYAITQTLASLDNNDFSLVYQEVKKLINDLKDTQRKLEDDFSNVDRLEKISQKKVSASVFCEDLNIPVVS
jgi:hypothetical protein